MDSVRGHEVLGVAVFGDKRARRTTSMSKLKSKIRINWRVRIGRGCALAFGGILCPFVGVILGPIGFFLSFFIGLFLLISAFGMVVFGRPFFTTEELRCPGCQRVILHPGGTFETGTCPHCGAICGGLNSRALESTRTTRFEGKITINWGARLGAACALAVGGIFCLNLASSTGPAGLMFFGPLGLFMLFTAGCIIVTGRAYERKNFACPECFQEIASPCGYFETGECPHCGTTYRG